MYQLMPSLSELHCSYNTPFTHSLWYLKYSLCRRKQSEPESPSVLSGTFRSSDEEKQQRPTSNHVTTNHPNMSACVTRWCVGFLICKKKKKKKEKARHSARCLMREVSFFSEAHCPRNCLITALLFMVLDCLL